jgi:aminoglycoside 6'-N-acetyltransferase I
MEIRILRPGDAGVLANVVPGVFDRGVDVARTEEFLADPRHHLAVAIEDGAVVGFASGVDYIHPDKPRELWINEVGVAPGRQGRGVGKAVVRALLDEGRALGCTEAWVLTERGNTPAMRLYASLGGEEEPEPVMFTFRLDAEHTGRDP